MSFSEWILTNGENLQFVLCEGVTMKMTRIEKRFVNDAGHSRRVAEQAAGRLRHLPIQRGWRYLDVGCGTGAGALHVADAFGVQVVGVVVDPNQIQLARQAAGGRCDVVFLAADATRLPFEDDRFHIVATNKTTHHIPRWRAALGEMERVLMPGGYLIYEDLKAPLWLAAVLRPVVGRAAGVFTRDDLERSFAELHLHGIYKSTEWLHYEAVFTRRDREGIDACGARALRSQRGGGRPGRFEGDGR